MELCWENLDNLYLTKGGHLRKRVGCKSNTYVYRDKCKYCEKPFLAIRTVVKGKVTVNEFCSHSCCRTNRYCSPETRKKLSVSNIGKKRSKETKKKLSDLRKGTKLSDEIKKKLSEALTGKMVGKNNPMYKGGVVKLNLPLYDTFVHQFPEEFEETRSVIENGLKLLQVRCHNYGCRKWFTPKRSEVCDRLNVFNGKVSGAHDFYCSEQCKVDCPTYNRSKHRKDEKFTIREKPYTSEQYEFYRKTVFERENYICEYCGAKATEIHHEKSQKAHPMFAVDPDYGHAVCKKCHMKYGHKTGTECSTGALARKKCK